MCGICGEIAFNGKAASTDAVRGMTEVLHRRGPDGEGIYWQRSAAFGHCRLKIIDLSDAAAQPMVDPHLGLTLVFNGMIYNYRELRKQLEGKGHRFFSQGDSEVVLKAYAEWGDKCVERFNGMFAFAISERDSGRTFIARDRLGIKPLYYAETADGNLRFASSLPALLKAGKVDTSIDPVALHHYMTFHSVVPAPYTIVRGVRKLPPATTMSIDGQGKRSLHRYWEPVFNLSSEEAHYSFDDWKARLGDVLRQAINRRMIADVPVGVLLSGGLDSSLVVGMLAEAGQKNLNTFSIGFESVGGEEGDEFKYSDVIAERFDTQHHKIQVDSSRSLAEMEGCVRAMSEPMVSHDAIGFYLLSQEVSKHVKVVQSGQGADEVFAGYHWYPPMMDVSADSGDEALTAYAKAFFDRDHEEYTQAVDPSLVDRDFSRAFVREHFGAEGADHPIDQTLRLDTTVMLVDDPVKRVDNMTMAWSLEARVPFLDHELVELAARIPAEHKVGSIESWEKTGGKHILKEVARDVIPASVIDRPKGYFPVPALKYLRGPYLDFVHDILEQPAARQRTLFNRDYVNTLLADPEQHITPLRGSKLWQVTLLEYWLQTHGVG